jgi:hypothetical protein
LSALEPHDCLPLYGELTNKKNFCTYMKTKCVSTVISSVRDLNIFLHQLACDSVLATHTLSTPSSATCKYVLWLAVQHRVCFTASTRANAAYTMAYTVCLYATLADCATPMCLTRFATAMQSVCFVPLCYRLCDRCAVCAYTRSKLELVAQL